MAPKKRKQRVGKVAEVHTKKHKLKKHVKQTSKRASTADGRQDDDNDEEVLGDSPSKGSSVERSSAIASCTSVGSRARMNILVTGTPGVGKTTLCSALASSCAMSHIEVGKLISEKKLYTEWDDEMNCSIFDEDMVCDALEPLLKSGNCIVDFHSASDFPKEWFDLYIVLRADTQMMWQRLESRKYPEAKIKENVEAEIFQTCLEEVREATEGSSIPVWEMPNNTKADMKGIAERVQEFCRAAEQRK
eukprot:TRINITY_DN59824_c0_g1_i1.p1 TRINITY_DN59824_c0_g1~~TRINITY_DN59824_c0_g1_i1.p1  ORF type:complete len:257 (-),score=55.81 TRINITY_DN59824_c0_g1_i1:20-760(-)